MSEERKKRLARIRADVRDLESALLTLQKHLPSACHWANESFKRLYRLARLARKADADLSYVVRGHNPNAASPSDLPAREAVAWSDGPKVREARRGLRLLFLEAPESVVSDVTRLVEEAFDEIAALQPLSQGNGEAVGADHKSIWLLPVCDREHCDNCRDDRTWHEDRLPICDECGAGPTQYIRADLYAAPPSQPEGVREALEAAKRTLAAYQEHGAPHAFVGDISLQKVYALIDAAIDAITPSRGLVEAAEWHEEQATAYDKQSDILDTSGLVAAIHRECAQHFRTLSAKPTDAH